jgi:hypothetical protein
METVKWVITIALSAAACIVFIYVAVRVGSFAFFRSRMEHFRRVLRVAKEEGDGNGRK